MCRKQLLLLPLVAIAIMSGCRQSESGEDKELAAPPLAAAAPPTPPSASAPAPSVQAPHEPACPSGMRMIAGGLFWMGAPYATSKADDNPHRHVAVKSFCLDETEFTVAQYRECVSKGSCKASYDNAFSCNGGRKDRGDHPINCVDWPMADAACKASGKRLPTEQEWEYAARGGAEERVYAWGSEGPEGRSCYNHPGTCAVKSYAPGAFSLFDMTGNVWEWTASPYTTEQGWTLPGDWRIYRGGSYSRRFPKWMKTWLRNRFRAEEWGAHLGFRCAQTVPASTCPVGSHAKDQDCHIDGEPEPEPPRSVLRGPSTVTPVVSASHPTTPAKPLVVTRDTGFDEDCQRYKPGRPNAYLLKGSSFAERQRKKAELGCDNRDVGMDFNSVCCPN